MNETEYLVITDLN